MRIKRVAVIHYMPLEIYPPVMNLVKTWDKMNTGIPMNVYTTRIDKPSLNFIPGSTITQVKRYGVSGRKRSFLTGLWHYLYYYFATLCMLIKTRPVNVLYFDTISSFPAIIYKMLVPKSRLFVHYNEYMSANEYQHGMFLVRWFHKLEKKIYRRTEWVSHTNLQRMKLFLTDMPGTEIPHQH